MKFNKVIALVLSIVMVGTIISGCSSKPATGKETQETTSAKPEFVFKFAYDDTTTASYYKGLEAFKADVEKNSGGKIQVNIFADKSLGSATDTIQGLKLGTIECTFASTAALSGFVPEYAIVDAPFIFRDADHADKVIDGEIGKMLRDKTLSSQNIRVMGFMDTGFRNIYSSKPLTAIADFKGFKIRTMESTLHTKTFSLLGAIATAMPSAEVFTSLQQGTIDAAENCFSYVLNQKLYEAAKYITKTEHFYGFCTILISEIVFKKLSPELQKVVLDAADHSIEVQRKIAAEDNINAEKVLQEKYGVKVFEINKEELFNKVEPLYTQESKLLDPALVEKIKKQK